jgi:hypothetical protein
VLARLTVTQDRESELQPILAAIAQRDALLHDKAELGERAVVVDVCVNA